MNIKQLETTAVKLNTELYDTLFFPAGAPLNNDSKQVDKTCILFFGNVAVDTMDRLHTNMEVPYSLNDGQYFHVKEIVFNDNAGMVHFAENAVFEFFIGGCRVMTLPLIHAYYPNTIRLKEPLLILPKQNFMVSIKLLCKVQLNFNYELKCELRGDFYRS